MFMVFTLWLVGCACYCALSVLSRSGMILHRFHTCTFLAFFIRKTDKLLMLHLTVEYTSQWEKTQLPRPNSGKTTQLCYQIARRSAFQRWQRQHLCRLDCATSSMANSDPHNRSTEQSRFMDVPLSERRVDTAPGGSLGHTAKNRQSRWKR